MLMPSFRPAGGTHLPIRSCRPNPSKPNSSGSRPAFTANCSTRSICRGSPASRTTSCAKTSAAWPKGCSAAGRKSCRPIDEERLVDELMAESFGLGPLEPYMQDPDVTDILVNGPHEVYVERLGRLQETNTVFADEDHLLQIIQRIVARVGRRIDEHSPMVDARLPDGSPRERHHSAAGPGRPGALDSPLRPSAAANRRPAGPRLGLPGNAAAARSGRRRPHQHHDQRRHRRRQNDAAQQRLAVHPRQRTPGDDRRLGRTQAAAEARREAGNAAQECGRDQRSHASATWCATPCACGPTASSSAKSAAAKPSTCCRR